MDGHKYEVKWYTGNKPAQTFIRPLLTGPSVFFKASLTEWATSDGRVRDKLTEP